MPEDLERGEDLDGHHGLVSRILSRSTIALPGQANGSLSWLFGAEPARPMRELLWRLWLPLVLVQSVLVPGGHVWSKLVYGALLASGLVALLALAYCGTVRVTIGTGTWLAQRIVVGVYLVGILASVVWWTGWSSLEPSATWQRALVWPIQLVIEFAASLVPG